MIKVYVKKICKLTPEEEHRVTSTLSDRARARLAKKTNEALRTASLCALSLLTDEQRSALDYSTQGRPSLTRLKTDISISHSKAYVAVAISDFFRDYVGIDIEDVEHQTSSTRFLTENEQNALKNGANYIEIWTKKEALYKFLKSDCAPFVQLDSTRPDLYGASFTTLTVNSSILTVCTPPDKKIEIIQK